MPAGAISGRVGGVRCRADQAVIAAWSARAERLVFAVSSIVEAARRRPWIGFGTGPTRSFSKEGAIEAPERRRHSKIALPVRRKTPNFSMRPNPGNSTQDGSIRAVNDTLYVAGFNLGLLMWAKIGCGTPQGWADAWFVAIWTEQMPTTVCLGLMLCLENHTCLILPLASIHSFD